MTSFRDNTERRRYELEAPEGVSIAEYRDIAHARAILHVESPEAAQGKGYASKLMHEVVADARAKGQKLRASCPFAVAYFKRHPDEVADVNAD